MNFVHAFVPHTHAALTCTPGMSLWADSGARPAYRTAAKRIISVSVSARTNSTTHNRTSATSISSNSSSNTATQLHNCTPTAPVGRGRGGTKPSNPLIAAFQSFSQRVSQRLQSPVAGFHSRFPPCCGSSSCAASSRLH